jgi:hypothetical protein
MIICCWCYCALGWNHLLEAIGYGVANEVYCFPFSRLHTLSILLFSRMYIHIADLSTVMAIPRSAIRLHAHLHPRRRHRARARLHGRLASIPVSIGETSVENQDHDVYRRMAKQRGDVSVLCAREALKLILIHKVFVNSYDLGRRRNFELFFNIGNRPGA